MAIKTKCFRCSQVFGAPDQTRGRVAKCPYCGAPNDILDLGGDDDELAALLEDERKKVVGGKAASAFADPSKPAGAAGKRTTPQKPQNWRQPPSKAQAQDKRIVDLAIIQMLAICVVVLGTGEIIAAVACGQDFSNILFGMVGWLLAWGTWREHQTRKPTPGTPQIWDQVEFWVGLVAAILLGLWGTISFVGPAFPVIQAGINSHAAGYLVKMVLFWLAIVAYCVGLFVMACRGRFFSTASWTYILGCGILLLFFTPFSEGVRVVREGAQKESAMLLAGGPRNEAVKPPEVNQAGAPPVIEQRPPENNQPPAANVGNPTPPEITSQQAENTSPPTAPPEEQQATTAALPQIPWQAAADPDAHPVVRPWVRQPAIPLQTAEFAWPSASSPLLAVLSKGQNESSADLWNLSTACSNGLIRGSFDFRESTLLSRDGKYLAGTGEFGVEIWSFETGKLLARLPLDKHAGDTVVDFLSDDTILVVGNTAKSAQYKVWNFGPDTNVRKSDLPAGVMLDGRSLVVSPGRHYLAGYGQGAVWVVNLQKGELCGMLPVSKSADPAASNEEAALSFSPDGSELVGIIGNSQGSRLMAWALADGTATANFELSDGITNRGKARVLECFPNNQGWLVDGRFVVDRSGQAWPIIRHELRVLGLADSEHVIVCNDQMLSTWKLARLPDGRLKLATLEIQREDLPAVMFNRDSGTPATGDAFNRASKRYRNQVELDVLAADDSVLLQTLRWCPVLKQPYMELRWGTGNQTQISGAAPASRLEDTVGPMGTAVTNELQRRLDSGAFGQDPQVGDPRLSGILFAGSGTRSELLKTATAMGLSAVVIFQVPQQMPGAPKRPDEQMKIHVVDITGKVQWEHTAPNTAPGGQTGEPDPDEIANSAGDIGKYLDDNYDLQPMPEMQQKDIAPRIKRLGVEAHDDLLVVLAEVRYYQLKGLLSTEEAVAAFRTWMSEERAQIMATGTPAQRRTMLEQWLKTAKT